MRQAIHRWASLPKWPSFEHNSHVLWTAFLYVITLCIAYGLKHHYSQARSDDLVWILRPTAMLVQWFSGLEFVHERGTGYINYSHSMIIAPACAGVNFLIVAWCMALFSFLHRCCCFKKQLLWFGGCAAGTYLLTLMTNTLRILVAIGFYQTNTHVGWLTPGRLHRLEGVIIYFAALYLYYSILQSAVGRKTWPRGPELLPACWYFLILLAVPVVRSAYRQEPARFLEHSGFVLLAGIGMTFAVWLIQKGWRRGIRYRSVKDSFIEGFALKIIRKK